MFLVSLELLANDTIFCVHKVSFSQKILKTKNRKTTIPGFALLLIQLCIPVSLGAHSGALKLCPTQKHPFSHHQQTLIMEILFQQV